MSRCPLSKAIGSIPTSLTTAPARGKAPFVSFSKFVIANDKTVEVKEGFRQHPHLVDGQPDFVPMEVLIKL